VLYNKYHLLYNFLFILSSFEEVFFLSKKGYDIIWRRPFVFSNYARRTATESLRGIATDSVENFYFLQCIINVFLIIRQNARVIRQVKTSNLPFIDSTMMVFTKSTELLACSF
jgi:hypothetical protein